MSADTLIEELREAVRYCDEKAAVVSNLRKPRSDNDYGRMAALHERAADRIATLEAALADAKKALAPMAKCYQHLQKHPGELPNVTMLQWRLASEAFAALAGAK